MRTMMKPTLMGKTSIRYRHFTPRFIYVGWFDRSFLSATSIYALYEVFS